MSRGKCIAVSDVFVWLYWDRLKDYQTVTPFYMDLIGVEGLRAMEQACRMAGCTRQQVEDMFYNNAMELFGLSD